MMSWLKTLSFKIASLIAALVITIAVAETALRLMKSVTKIYYPAGRSFEALYIPDERYVYGLKPDTVYKHYSYYGDFTATYHINSDGLRAVRNYNRKKPNGMKRILILGDSYAFGRGVEDDETCAAVLEKMLNNDGENVEVLNSGTLGYSTDNEYVYMRERALLFDPDLVILMVFPRNDIMDMRHHDWVTDENGLPKVIIDHYYAVDNYGYLINIAKDGKNLNTSRFKKFMRNHSYVYTFLSEHRYYLKYEWKWLGTFYRKADNKAISDDEARIFRIGKASAEEKAMLERMRKLLIGMKDLAAKNNKRFLVVLIPDSIYDEYIRTLAEANGIEIVDIDRQARINGIKNLYLPKDMHWSRSGNAYVAGIIYERLAHATSHKPDITLKRGSICNRIEGAYET